MRKYYSTITNLVFFVFVITIYSCSKSQEYSIIDSGDAIIHKNGNKPETENLNIKSELLFQIKSGGSTAENEYPISKIGNVGVDNHGAIYVLDSKECSIFKIDSKGKLIRKFCQQGTGPGELPYINLISVIDDTIYATCVEAQVIAKFDAEGNFIKNILFDDRAPVAIKKLSDTSFVAVSDNVNNENNYTIIKTYLTLYDSKLKEISKIIVGNKKIKSNNLNPSDFVVNYAIKNSKCYMAKIDENKFGIDICNDKFKVTEKITKPYTKILLNERQKEIMAIGVGQEGKKNVVMESYHKSINGLWIDKHDYLWVATAFDQNEGDSTLFFDIFKDGKYYSRVKSDFHKDIYRTLMDLYFEKDYIISVDRDRGVINVYNYRIVD